MNNVNEKKHRVRTIATVLAAAVLLGSCSIGLSPDTQGPETDLAELDAQLSVTANSAVAAAEAQLAASGGIGASTTYNNPGMDPVAVAAGETATLPARANYPYPGWTTTGEVEHIADPATYSSDRGWSNAVAGTNRLFKVTTNAAPDETGVYPEDEVREVYYVESPDSAFSDTDWIFAPYDWAGSGFRDEYVADYADGSVRNHWIMAASTTSYAAFDIDGTLDFDSISEAGWVANDPEAIYSSATMYTHELGQTFNYWFWNDNEAVTPYIFAVRYYTEHLVGDEYVGTSLTYEYSYDSSWRTSDETPLLLARTVIREETRFAHNDLNENGAFDAGEVGDATDHTLRMRTEINNSSGGDGLVYTRQGKSITDWNNRGNARNARLASVQRDVLPSGYADFSEFSATFDSLSGATE
ncbi:MAG TPA: hypothetical protein VJ932_06245 [Alkalispirochaeta sp.]|nr:hypothetical protein [Alkalispirochaeta sp.]